MTSPPPQRPVPVWEGRASGSVFAHLLRRRADLVGATVDVYVQVGSAGGYGVGAWWGEGFHDEDFFCEVVDWVDGVRLLDREAEDVTVEQALGYVEARLRGCSEREALRVARGGVAHRGGVAGGRSGVRADRAERSGR